MFFKKPYVLFAPDKEEYLDKRGFYVEYESLCPYVITEEKDLKETVLSVLAGQNEEWIQKQYDFHISACDGQVTERILAYVGL